jgi:hypothetical protein
VGALIGISAELTRGYHLLAETVGQVLFFEQSSADSSSASARPALRLTLGAGKHF